MTQSKYDVFISYSKQDDSFVRDLVIALRKKDVRAWYDEGELRVGDTILRQIEHALEHSRYFVLVISPKYLSDQWTSFELGVALTHEVSSGDERILPIFVGDVDRSGLPVMLSGKVGLNAKELSVEEIAAKLAAVIKRDKTNV